MVTEEKANQIQGLVVQTWQSNKKLDNEYTSYIKTWNIQTKSRVQKRQHQMKTKVKKNATDFIMIRLVIN